MVNNLFFKLNIFLIILIPIALITGPFLPDLMISISGIITIYYLIKRKFNSFLFNHYIIKFLLIFYIYILILSLFSSNIILSLESSLFYFRFIFFSLTIYFLLIHYKKFKIYFFYILLFTILIVSTDGVVEFFLNVNFLSLFNYDMYINSASIHSRLSSLFRDEWVIGSYLVRLMPILIYLYLNINLGKNLKKIFFLTIFLSSLAIILSGERAALIYLFLLFFIFSIFYIKKIKKYKLFIFLPVLFLIFLIPLLNDKLKNRVMHGFENYTSLNIENNIYLKYYDSSIKMFLDKPFFGHGPKMFRVVCKKYIQNDTNYGCSTHPHNNYVQLLGETGFIGFLFLLISFIYFTTNLFKFFLFDNQYDLKKYLSSVVLLILFIINLQPLIPTNNFFGNWINIFYYLPLGFYLHSLEKDNY